MASVPVMKVFHKKKKKEMIVNVSDYQENKELYSLPGEKEEAEKKEKKKDKFQNEPKN